MKKTLILVLMFVVSGCIETKYSEVKQEGAEVLQLSYVPSVTSDVSGISMNGKGGIGYVSGSSTSPEVWAVVLRCDRHRKTFALRSKELYSRVKPGDRVELDYVEEIEYDPDVPGSDKIMDYHTRGVRIGSSIIKRTAEE